MISDQELISKLQTLKQIAPSKEWVFSAKMQILEQNKVFAPVMQSEGQGILHILQSFLYNRRIAYSFAVLLLLVFGGYALSPITELKNTDNKPSVALLAAEAELKNNFKIMAEKSENLALAIEREPQRIESAIAETKVAVKNVTESIRKEPELTNTIASEVSKSRTYLTIAGEDSDLKEAADGFHKLICERMLPVLEKNAVLEEDQQLLKDIKAMYENKEYALAFENMLMLNAQIQTKIEVSGE